MHSPRIVTPCVISSRIKVARDPPRSHVQHIIVRSPVSVTSQPASRACLLSNHSVHGLRSNGCTLSHTSGQEPAKLRGPCTVGLAKLAKQAPSPSAVVARKKLVVASKKLVVTSPESPSRWFSSQSKRLEGHCSQSSLASRSPCRGSSSPQLIARTTTKVQSVHLLRHVESLKPVDEHVGSSSDVMEPSSHAQPQAAKTSTLDPSVRRRILESMQEVRPKPSHAAPALLREAARPQGSIA